MIELGWREMRVDDIDGVVAVAAACFPEHFEARICFQERQALYPLGCFVLAAEDAIAGYLIAYPHPFGAIPALNSLLGELQETSQALYLHDLALHPDVRGGGFARPILDRLFNLAQDRGIRCIHLVAVNGSMPFWERMGFTPVSISPELTRKLQTYGGDAGYLVRNL